LLALNHERYEEEVRQGLHEKKKKGKRGKRASRRKKRSSENQPRLL
jgi:DNA invertase Pin-like site-specific DNA recombinase